MVELRDADFAGVLPLLSSSQPLYTPMASVVERRQRGRIFADRRRQPTAALICHVDGRIYGLSGDAQHTAFVHSLPELLTTGPPSDTPWWGFVTDTPDWDAPLDAAFSRGLRKRAGVSFDLDMAAFRRKGRWRDDMSSGCEIRAMTTDIVDVTAASLPAGFPFPWQSPQHFVTEGFGFALWRGGEPVSIAFAYTACVTGGQIELAIATAEAHRRRGYAVLACSAFIEHALDHGITPVWNCDPENAGSMALAASLGFRQRGAHTMYSLA